MTTDHQRPDSPFLGALPAGHSADISAIVLAAGSSSRLHTTSRPGLLEDLCGQPIVASVLETVVDAGMSGGGISGGGISGGIAVVVASGAEDVVKTLQGRIGGAGVVFAEQHVQRGTGDAVLAGLAALDDQHYRSLDDLPLGTYADDEGHVLIVHGDLPLLTADLLSELVEHHRQTGAEATVLASPAAGPFVARPRLRRNTAGALESIAAHDTVHDGAAPPLAVAGCYIIRRGHLAAAIRRTTPQNLRGEFNLNDALVVLASAGHKVETFVVGDGIDAHHLDSLRSIGSYEDLASAEAIVRQRISTSWMARGIRMVDPTRTYIDADVVLGTGVTLQPGTILRGFTVVGDHAEIGPDTHLTDCAIGQRAKVIRTTGRDAEVGPDAVVGPFAALEPGAQIAPNAITGPNFVGQYSD